MGISKVIALIRQGDFSEAKRVMNEYIDDNKIKKDDISIVKNYYIANNSSYSGYILYKMQCVCGEFFDAYETYLSLISKYLRKRDISLVDLVNKVDDIMIETIAKDFKNKLEDDIDIPQSVIVSEIIDVLVPRIINSEIVDKNKIIAEIAERMWFEELKTSDYMYEIAMACLGINDDLAEKMFLKIIEKEPANCMALNDIGVLLEKKGDYQRAKVYYEKAHNFSVDNVEYNANYNRILELCP